MSDIAPDLDLIAPEPSKTGENEGARVVTFGCRLNFYESEAVKKAAVTGLGADAKNLIIFNTCAVTKEAVRQAKQAIRKAKRENPNAKIVVTGCAAQIDSGDFSQMAEVDKIIGNEEKSQPETFANFGGSEKIIVNDIMSVTETAFHLIEGLEGRTRAYLQVQNGCDHRCTFCIIPFGRGNSRSVPAGEVVAAINHLVKNGVKEVVLSGVDLTAWGADLPAKPNLGMLVGRILKLCPKLPRLRLSSIDAVEIDENLFSLFANESRLMPHLHLSLQHGDDLILKRMKRRHLRHHAIELCKRLKAARPEMAFGADIIAGFPTESEAHFAHSLSLIDECELSFVHVFPYSQRPNTPAQKMPQVNGALIKERARLLREKGEQALKMLLHKQIGSTQNVLLETGEFGRLDNFARIKILGGNAGEIIKAKITGIENNYLLGAKI